MSPYPNIALLVAGVILAGCVTTQSRIERERALYLTDPTTSCYGYDGKLLKGGEHGRYLFAHDPAFGDFLFSVMPKTRDTRIVMDALRFFAWKHPDAVKFEKIVASIEPCLLDEQVDMSCTDYILMAPLREWIEEEREILNQAIRLKGMPVAPPAEGDPRRT